MDSTHRSEKTVRKHLAEAGLIFLMGLPAAALLCSSCWNEPRFYYVTVPFSGVIWMTLWKGNELVSAGLNRLLPWSQAPLRRLVLNLLCTVAYTVVAMVGITSLFFYLVGEPRALSLPMVFEFGGPAVLITIFIATFVHARGFFLSWRELAVQHERLKKESLSSQYEVLKQQVNPHFLFNSLNTLTSLVYEDADLSAKFIKKLSNVYRYVLESHGKEVAPLAEERAFVESYVFLQKIRYGDHFQVDIDLPDRRDIFIPPLALQMLIENAVKHNEVSAEHPLVVRISLEGEVIVVRNKIEKRAQPPGYSVQVGLKNIQSRYELLANESVIVAEENGEFTVKLPALYDKQ